MKKEAIINVLNHDLERLAIVDEYNILSFTRNYNDIGEFLIVLDAYSNQAKLINKGDFILIDNDMSKFGFIHEKTFEDNEDGTSTITLRGNTLGVIFDWRQIIPKENEVCDKYEGNVESVLYYYIYNHCVNAHDISRNFPLLKVAENKHTGKVIRWEAKESNLLDEIKTIAEIYDYGFRVNLDLENRSYQFEVYQGRDLTVSNPEKWIGYTKLDR